MIAQIPSTDFEYALVCDDVRQEANGKFFFIGVYSNSILLAEFPVLIRLRLVMRFHPRIHEFPLGIRVKLDDDALLIFKGKISSSTLEPETSPSPELHLQIKSPGALTFEVTDSEFEPNDASTAQWTPLYSIPVGPLISDS